MHKDTQSLIRQHFRAMDGYVSAGMESDKTSDKIFMNANENPFALPGLDGCNYYPEPQPKEVVDRLAKLYGVAPEHLLVTRGADESIVLLTRLFCEPHQDSVLICPPTFGMYGVNANAAPVSITSVPLLRTNEGYCLDEQGVIAAASDPARCVKLVYLCSPNNPTGDVIPSDVVLRICQALAGKAMVVLDEAYIEFAQQESLSSELVNYPNLIILRTLSKAYAMAGVRIGVTLSGDAGLISTINSKLLDAYPIPVPCIEVVLRALSDENQPLARENMVKMIQERDRIKAHFMQSGKVDYIYPSQGNFILVKLPKVHEFFEYCQQHDIILRDFSSKEGTEGCVRISPSLPEANDKFLALFDAFYA